MKKNSFIGRYKAFFLFAALLSFTIISCKESDKDVPKPKTIEDIILGNSDFSILKEIIRYTGMNDALRTENLTLFAPNDAAFRSSDINNASDITSMPVDSARSFVKYHILKGSIQYNDLKKGNNKALNGKFITIRTDSASVDSILKINDALVILKNLNADNGIIQVVDRTLTFKQK